MQTTADEDILPVLVRATMRVAVDKIRGYASREPNKMKEEDTMKSKINTLANKAISEAIGIVASIGACLPNS